MFRRAVPAITFPKKKRQAVVQVPGCHVLFCLLFQTEALLTIVFAEKLTEAVIRINLPKTSPHPVDVDHLIVNQMNEVARVRPVDPKYSSYFSQYGYPFNFSLKIF